MLKSMHKAVLMLGTRHEPKLKCATDLKIPWPRRYFPKKGVSQTPGNKPNSAETDKSLRGRPLETRGVSV